MRRARVVPASEAASAPLLLPGPSAAQRRRIAREELGARMAAERILSEAHERAQALLGRAREEAGALAATAVHEARRAADAELTARWVALREIEGRRLDAQSDRIVAIAVALAERLLGAALELHPERVVELARVVVDEARGARRAIVDAHPLDADALRRHLTEAGGESFGTLRSLEIRDEPTLARGELRLHTDVGTIDARLPPRFERLASALRDALG